MTRVLVTGANGHLGANIVRSLLRHGHEVVPFVRRTSDLRGLEGLNLAYRYGDMMNLDSLVAAAAGCEVIIHAAAVYRFWIKKPDDLIRSTLAGTRHVFEAAQAVGARRMVYTSTTFAVGASPDPHTLRTPDDWNGELYLPYTIAKVQAEKLAWQLADELSIPTIAFCPHGILGPYDYGITPTTALLRDLVNGRGITNPSGFSFVDARDVAEVYAQAIDGGQPGQRYLLAGENLTMKAIGEIVTRLTGVKPRHLGVGRRTAWFMAALMELGAKLSGSTPLLTRAMALELIERYHYYDCSKTKQDFDFTPRRAEEMMADAIRWLLYLSEIKPRVAKPLIAKLLPDPQWQVA